MVEVYVGFAVGVDGDWDVLCVDLVMVSRAQQDEVVQAG